eukprot:Hpha_TRINITY_DN4587_c0_g1::TRINITY_DN4587_c0_g1_i1::g.115504::m.115504
MSQAGDSYSESVGAGLSGESESQADASARSGLSRILRRGGGGAEDKSYRRISRTFSGHALREGPIERLGGWGIERRQARWGTLLSSGYLLLHKVRTEGKKQVKGELDGGLELAGARVIDRGEYMGAHCFSVEGMTLKSDEEGKCTDELFFFTKERKEKWVWVGMLQDAAVEATGESTECASPAAASPRNLNKEQSPVLAYASPYCADCGADQPTWCVVAPFGVFVCIDCIGVHRALHAGRCKEAQLDGWSEEQLSFFRYRGGNEGANAELERAHPGEGKAPPKPVPSSCRVVREEYIKAKYIDKAFADPDAAPNPPPRAPDESASPKAKKYGEPPAYSGVVMMEGVRLQGIGSTPLVG